MFSIKNYGQRVIPSYLLEYIERSMDSQLNGSACVQRATGPCLSHDQLGSRHFLPTNYIQGKTFVIFKQNNV